MPAKTSRTRSAKSPTSAKASKQAAKSNPRPLKGRSIKTPPQSPQAAPQAPATSKLANGRRRRPAGEEGQNDQPVPVPRTLVPLGSVLVEGEVLQAVATAFTETLNIPIYCAHSALLDYRTLKPNPSNPNIHPRQQIELLAGVIRKNGWRAPIVVSSRSGYVVKGHGRIEAASMLFAAAGECQVPVEYQHYNSAAEEYADMVADNRIAELSTMDMSKVGDIMKELKLSLGEVSFDFGSFGYTSEELVAFEPADPGSENAPPEVHQPADKGELLDLVGLTLEEPTQAVERNQVWQIGRHLLICTGVARDWTRWTSLLQPGDVLALFPTPLMPCSDAALKHRLIMVHPSPYVCGHIIDHFRTLFPTEPCEIRMAPAA